MKNLLLFGNGQQYHVGAHFKRALDELKINYVFVDEWKLLEHLYDSYIQKIYYHLLKRPITYDRYNREIIKQAIQFQPNIVLIIKGAFINPKTLKRIKEETSATIINLATDDPKNEKSSTKDIINSIPYYDLYACTKRSIMADIKQLGCPEVIFVPFGFDPSTHFPEAPVSEIEINKFCSDVNFIGAVDQDRVPIIRQIAQERDINLRLYGGYWNRYKEFRKFYQGFAIGRSFRLAIGGAKISIGLVRRANRDGHAMRSLEIPACGGFMLAERTEEHMEMFIEGKEAEFFGSNEEMTEKIRYYLRHDRERRRIAEFGHLKVINGNNTYRDRLINILKSAEFN